MIFLTNLQRAAFELCCLTRATRLTSIQLDRQPSRTKTQQTPNGLSHVPGINSGTKSVDADEVIKEFIKDPSIALEGAKLARKECIRWGQEFLSKYDLKVSKSCDGDIEMLFTFEDDQSIDKFVLTTDKDNNIGYSTASFVRTQYDTGMFTGYISTRLPDDGQTQRTGFAMINSKRVTRSFLRHATYNWMDYTHIVLKIRGDGRVYHLVLSCPQKYDITWNHQYTYPIYTRGGPYWQIVKIPFSHFYFTTKGRIEENQVPMCKTQCSRVGILLTDNIEGPFKFEIEYVGLEYQLFHLDISPYENYLLEPDIKNRFEND